MSSRKSFSEFIKPPKVKTYKKVLNSTPDVKVIQESSSDSSGHGTVSYGTIPQEHARPRQKGPLGHSTSRMSSMDIAESLSNTSLSSSITK